MNIAKIIRHEKFEKAGMDKIYRSLYLTLCGYSHGALYALDKRRVDRKEGKVTIVFDKETTQEERATETFFITLALLTATESVHSFFNSSILDDVLSYREACNQLYNVISKELDVESLANMGNKA